MAWLQKRPQVSDPKMFYSVGLNKTAIIVGLGNPGQEYNLTRHNIGFMCVDEFVKKNSEMSDWTLKKNLKCLESTGRIGETRTIVIKPTTFMNLSGEAVQAASSFYKVPVDEILVVHDDIDVDFGQIRMRVGGSSAGHNGIKSISNLMGENYGRIRIGIGPKAPTTVKSEDFVLKKFTKTEQEQLPNLLIEVNAVLSEYLYSNQLPHDTRNFLV